MAVGTHRPYSEYLYELRPDGSIRTDYVVSHSSDVAFGAPTFVTDPTDPEGGLRLYWIVYQGTVDLGTQTLAQTVMTATDTGPVEVDTHLRWGQAPGMLSAYPGSLTNALTIFRRANVPTSYEVLVYDQKWTQAEDASPTSWGSWQDVANTDASIGVPWLTQGRYLVPVAHQYDRPKMQILEYTEGCEFDAPRVVYAGTALDAGMQEAAWRMLALDARNVMVLDLRDVSHVITASHMGSHVEVPWRVLDTKTGAISGTDALWSDGDGAWTTVRPAVSGTGGAHKCGALSR